MWCPITFRVSKLWNNSYRIPIEELRIEENWLICRHLIVFSGNLLTLIYGLVTLISIYWFDNPKILMRELLCRQLVNNAITTGVCLIIISMFGCISLFIKSHFREFMANFTDTNYWAQNERKVIKIVTYRGDDPQALLELIIDYMRRKLKLLKRCFLLSPVFTLNALLITSLMPFEFSVVKKCIHYLIENRTAIKALNLYTINASGLVFVLCINVLFISVILIQLFVFIYVCDLINTSLDKHSQRKRVIQELSGRPKSPALDRQLQNQMRIEALRQKNILFNKFLNQSSSNSLTEFISQKTRGLSDATTIVIPDEGSDVSSDGYIEASVIRSSYL